jgi:hypothetical protein
VGAWVRKDREAPLVPAALSRSLSVLLAWGLELGAWRAVLLVGAWLQKWEGEWRLALVGAWRLLRACWGLTGAWGLRLLGVGLGLGLLGVGLGLGLLGVGLELGAWSNIIASCWRSEGVPAPSPQLAARGLFVRSVQHTRLRSPLAFRPRPHFFISRQRQNPLLARFAWSSWVLAAMQGLRSFIAPCLGPRH